jgi:release factor-specific protein-(glutamine-N5) methyltransferase
LDEADTSGENLFLDYIEKRKKHMPSAYITGKAYFMSLPIHVTAGVLIPRPETELLAEKILETAVYIDKSPVNVLDICSGSGCVGIAAAHYNPAIKALLSDISPCCEASAHENIRLNDAGERVGFVRSDLFENLKGKRFDIIACNPPYIPREDIKNLMEDVRDYEPHLALDGGEDGFCFYRRIIKEGVGYLEKNGFLLLEAGMGQSEGIRWLLESSGYNNIEVYKDFSGINRVVKASLNRV